MLPIESVILNKNSILCIQKIFHLIKHRTKSKRFNKHIAKHTIKIGQHQKDIKNSYHRKNIEMIIITARKKKIKN